MTKSILITLPLLLLSACGADAPVAEAPKAPAAFPEGEWEATLTVDAFNSTDRSTPLVTAKTGDKATAKVCVADAAQLVDLVKAKGDTCKEVSVYSRNGRINNGHQCRRPGVSGTVNLLLIGQFTADSASLEVATETVFSGDGDYRMKQAVEAKRLGDCVAAAPAPAAAG